jgi:hypothetical protein
VKTTPTALKNCVRISRLSAAATMTYAPFDAQSKNACGIIYIFVTCKSKKWNLY